MQYFCLFAIMLTLPAMQLGPASAQQKQSVNVEDLVTKVTVTGRLNVPLRKVMAIEAEWRPPRGLAAKPDNRIKLYVTRIGGKQLKTSVVFDSYHVVDGKGNLIEPKPGRKLKLHAYEDWVVKNYHPPEYAKLLGTATAGIQRQESTQLHGMMRSN